jgi:hypothetical protein
MTQNAVQLIQAAVMQYQFAFAFCVVLDFDQSPKALRQLIL